MTARESIAVAPMFIVSVLGIIMLIYSWWKYFSVKNQELLMSSDTKEALTIADPIAKTIIVGILLIVVAVIFFKSQSQNNNHGGITLDSRHKYFK